MNMHILHRILLVTALTAVIGCAQHVKLPEEAIQTVYIAESDKSNPVSQYAPAFVIHSHQKEHNRIGRPSALITDGGKEKIYIDASDPVTYYMVNTFETDKDRYTNYHYRIHFPGIPFSLVPFHLGAGKNVGLITVITVDSRDKPVLVTTVHTCGCYLAIVPTSYLPEHSLPDTWIGGRLKVYGERLPATLDYSDHASPRVTIYIRPSVHRVMDIKNMENAHINSRTNFNIIKTRLEPAEKLTQLSLNGDSTSFYHTEGARRGLVKGSVKIWESLFLGLISMDLFVGSDKSYDYTGERDRKFYTSLKPWNRDESDMQDFKGFLEFWGWKL